MPNTEANENMDKKKIIKSVIAIAASAIILFTFIYGNHMKKTVSQWDNRIYPEIYVEDMDIGGMTREEAANAIKEEYGNKILNKTLNIEASGNTYTLKYSDINARYNIEECVNEAFNELRESSTLHKYNTIKKGADIHISLKFESDNEGIDELIKKIASENNISPKNASISIKNGQISVSDGTNGAEVNTDKLKEDILNSIDGDHTSQLSVQAEIKTTNPQITSDSLKQINGKLSTYSTNFASSSRERAHNVELSTSSINGTVLMPGQTFSYNDIVGERTLSRGYKEAAVIIGDKVEPGLGGGICQTSSTLYQAVIRAGIKSVERYNHSLTVSYVPKGSDATVSWGGPDYKFTNPYDFPIYIEGIASNRNLTFNIYGNVNASNKTYSFSSDVYETLQPDTKTIEDPTLAEGTRVTEKSPVTGYRVRSYLKTYENGVLVKTEQVSNDTYLKVDGVVKVGTKKVQAPAPTTPPEQPQEPEQDPKPENQESKPENQE